MAQERQMVDPSYNRTRRAKRIEDEEAEIERMMKEMNGESGDDSESEEQEVQSEDSGEEDTDGGDTERSEDQEDDEESEQETKPKDEEEEDSEPEPKTAEEKTFKKRYGDLRRHLAQKEKEWEEKEEALKKQSTGQKVVAPKSDEDLDAWAEKYPDVAGIVHTIAEKKAQELFAKAEDRLKEFDEAQYEAKQIKAETAIRKSHPDFDKLRDSDEFHNWAEDQPKWVQDALYENADDAASVVRVIDLYKVDKGMTPSAKKQQKKKAAESVSSSDKPKVDPDEGSKKIRESDVAKWSDKEFEDRWDEIKEAQVTGNFVYDLSGGAR